MKELEALEPGARRERHVRVIWELHGHINRKYLVEKPTTRTTQLLARNLKRAPGIRESGNVRKAIGVAGYGNSVPFAEARRSGNSTLHMDK